ncbi:hypothetical protein D3C76_1293220 [compost metagenome]
MNDVPGDPAFRKRPGGLGSIGVEQIGEYMKAYGHSGPGGNVSNRDTREYQCNDAGDEQNP